MSLPMTTWHNKAHSNDKYLVNMDLTEEQKKHLIVALLLIIIAMQLNILQQQRLQIYVCWKHHLMYFFLGVIFAYKQIEYLNGSWPSY